MARIVKSPNDFFEILDELQDGKWITIGYVSAANLENVPMVKRKNPLTNRMKGYPDNTAFECQDEIAALVKVSSYNMHWMNREKFGKTYNTWKKSINGIRGNYGLPPIGDREGYKEKMNYGEHGIDAYNGQNQALQGHTYTSQNGYGVKPKSTIFCINQDGRIIRELRPEQVKPYLKQYKEFNPNAKSYRDDGARALAKLGAEDAKIQEFLAKAQELKFKYLSFEADSILWIAATINGEQFVYLNDNLKRVVDNVNINPSDFRELARERYKIELNSLPANDDDEMPDAALNEIVQNALKKVLAENYGMGMRQYNENQIIDTIGAKVEPLLGQIRNLKFTYEDYLEQMKNQRTWGGTFANAFYQAYEALDKMVSILHH